MDNHETQNAGDIASANPLLAFDLIFVFTQTPYGNSRAREGLEAALAAGAFDQRVAVIFSDDGVYQLLANQKAALLQAKNHQKMASALPLFGLETLFVCEESIKVRGLTTEQLILEPTLATSEKIAALLNQAKHCLSF